MSNLSTRTPFCNGKDQTENCANTSITIVMRCTHGAYMMTRTNVDESFPMIRPYSSASRIKRPVHKECPATSLTLQSSHPSQEVMLPISLHSQVLPHQHFSRVAPMNPATDGVFTTVTSPMISLKLRLPNSKSPLVIVSLTRVNSITKLLNSQQPSIIQSNST